MADDYTDSFAGEPYFIHKGEQLSAAGMTKALNTKEKVANKVASLSSTFTTDNEYPSAKAVNAALLHKDGNETITGVKTFGTASTAVEPLLGKAKTTDAANDGTKIASEAQVYKKQDKLTAEQLGLLASLSTLSFFPRGTILTFNKDAWDAKDNNFKQIWKVCDGTNGTPDLKNKFLRGAEYPAGSYGGADSQTRALELKHLPSHDHAFTGTSKTGMVGSACVWDTTDLKPTSPFSKGTYSGTLEGGDDAAIYKINFSYTPQGSIGKTGAGEKFTVDTVPSYYTVIYIMKVV
jgi:hypothetical protein